MTRLSDESSVFAGIPTLGSHFRDALRSVAIQKWVAASTRKAGGARLLSWNDSRACLVVRASGDSLFLALQYLVHLENRASGRPEKHGKSDGEIRDAADELGAASCLL